MSRDKAHVQDIVESFELAIRYLGSQSRDQLLADVRNLEAIIRRIEIVGEATKRLSETFRAANPQVPWREMAGMRDRVIHGYDQVDVERVHSAVSLRMVELLPELRRLRDSLPDPAWLTAMWLRAFSSVNYGTGRSGRRFDFANWASCW